jgi:glycosyltransferase involved in cell wall biosynthesis
MRILALTNLFPNAREPNRGCFNLQQFAALGRHADVRVIAPVAWQPWSHGWPRPLPYHDSWNGIPATYPSYFYTPGIGRAAYAALMYCSIRGAVIRAAREYRPDVLLATWAYPDVVAAAVLARQLKIPWVAKVHGSDVNVFTVPRPLRAQIRWALRQAACTFAVSTPLRDRLIEIGVPAETIRVQHNGVDIERFRLLETGAARQATGLPAGRPIIVYVGNLKEGKGVLDLLEAARTLNAQRGLTLDARRSTLGSDENVGAPSSAPSIVERRASSVERRASTEPLIVFVGDGPARGPIEEQIRRHDLADHVLLAGAQPHKSIPLWMAAADVFCLPSHREGCPNVVLEALACGRPVVATEVGAVPDLIDATSGVLVPPGEPARLAAALGQALSRDWDATALRARVLPLSWEANARALATALAHAAHQPTTTDQRPMTSAERSSASLPDPSGVRPSSLVVGRPEHPNT